MQDQKNITSSRQAKPGRSGIPSFLKKLFLLILAVSFIRFRPLFVLSGSMEPALPTGSLLIIDLKNIKPSEGDVITYRLSGKLITHRMVRDEGNRYITKGDNNPIEDPSPVMRKQIVGSVCLCIPLLGYLMAYLGRPGLFLPALILVVLFYNHILRKESS